MLTELNLKKLFSIYSYTQTAIKLWGKIYNLTARSITILLEFKRRKFLFILFHFV